MAFNFLSKLVNRPENIGEDDEGIPFDDVDEEIGEESDVECDGEEDNETSIDLAFDNKTLHLYNHSLFFLIDVMLCSKEIKLWKNVI